MRPALQQVAARLRGGELPSVVEFAALVREVGYSPGEARSAVGQYAAAVEPPSSSGEAAVLAALRGFTLHQ